MKKYQLLLFIIFLFPICLFAQNRIEKSTLKRIINESKVATHKGKFSLPSNKSWRFNNADSLYFIKDTITAFLYKSKYKSFCKQVDWTFYRKDAFVLGKEFNCEGSPTRLASENYYTIAIYYVENETMIDIFSYDKIIVESFKVINIKENSDATIITLCRRFNPYLASP